MISIAAIVVGLAQAPVGGVATSPAVVTSPATSPAATSPAATESVVVSPPPAVVAPAPGVVARPAPAPAVPVNVPPPGYSDAPPKGTWMRVGGGLALGVGVGLGLAALVCYAATDAVRGPEQQDDFNTLRLTAFGLGIGALAHVAAGVPLVVLGKLRRNRYREWERQRQVSWSPRVQVGERWTLGVALRF